MIKHIAFDFDGTLADSVEFCLAVFEKVFAKYMGEKAPDREAVYNNFGMNEPGVIRHFLGERNPAAEEYFYQLHRELHASWCPDVYAGCRDLLEFLQQRQIMMTILTGRSATTCNISLEFLDLKKYFINIQNGSYEKSDKSPQMLELLKKYNLQPHEVVYIGDAVSDVEASLRAGIKCLSAAWAKSARIAELEKINPGLVFSSVDAMKQYLAVH